MSAPILLQRGGGGGGGGERERVGGKELLITLWNRLLSLIWTERQGRKGSNFGIDYPINCSHPKRPGSVRILGVCISHHYSHPVRQPVRLTGSSALPGKMECRVTGLKTGRVWITWCQQIYAEVWSERGGWQPKPKDSKAHKACMVTQSGTNFLRFSGFLFIAD